MLRSVFVASLAFLLCSCITVRAIPTSYHEVEEQPAKSEHASRYREKVTRPLTFKLFLEPGKATPYCSATAIGPSAILTAEHCLPAIKGNVIGINDQLVRISKIIVDDMDHAIIVLDGHQFDQYARIGRLPRVGDSVFVWGNSMFDTFLRRGYVMTYVWNKPFIKIPSGTGWMALDMRISGGDSGAGVFNGRGHLVGVITGTISTSTSAYGTVMPFNFDRAAIRPYVPHTRRLDAR